MKTSNYLIALAALTSFTFVSCSDNDFLGDGPGGTFGSSSKGELSFAAGGSNATRGEITGEAAALKLNKKFTVYGWKQVNANSDADAAFQDVFQDYVVEWKGSASAGTSESNTAGWEYVGGTSQPVDGSQPYDQTIKYWDWSTDRYDFQAWSIANGNAQILSRNTVNNITTPTSSAPELQFFVPTAKDLGGVYVSDKFTSVPYLVAADVTAASGVVGADEGTVVNWSTDFAGGLANVESDAHPGKDYHRGKYSRIDNYTTKNKDGIVNLQFRNLAAKVRIGIYETIPGYKVSDVVFYEKNATNNYSYAWAAPGGSYTADLNADYPANQTYATLFADEDIFARRATVKVLYHDGYYMSGDKEKDNVAYTNMTPEGEKFFAFGQLTKEKGSTTPIGTDFIGETSNTASMSIGNDDDNLYTYVFPMEENNSSLELKVNYKLTSLDGSGEVIRVTGANATVPAEFAKWRSNYAYTYLFKVSDNTNGVTGEIYGPEGLYPITFDACLVNTEDGMQETITTINNKSITTYQDGSRVTANDEYKIANGLDAHDIYFTVESATANTLEDLTKNTNVKLYTAWAPAGTLITEESVANYKNNDIVLTDVTSELNDATSAPNSSGAKYAITFGAKKCLFFTPKANIYVVKYESSTDITYKVIKIQDGNAAKTYAITLATTSIANNGNTTFTILNSAASSTGSVTGAKGAIAIYDGGTKVNDKFKIEETSDYNYKITALEAEGTKTYTIKLEGATDKSLTVAAPVWSVSSINIEENTTGNVTLKDKTEGAALTGITPTVTPTTSPAASASKGTLAIAETSTPGTYAITPSEGAYGTFTVSYHGANLTVNVDKYKLALDHGAIINLGDAGDPHNNNKATLTLTNESNSDGKTAVSGIAVSATKDMVPETPEDIVTLSAATFPAGGTLTVTAAKVGTSTITAKNASINIEVINISLAAAATPADGVKRISLTDNTKPIATGETANMDGASFTIVKADPADTKVISVTGTTKSGIYKVSGGTSGKSYTIQYKYKGQVVAELDVTM